MPVARLDDVVVRFRRHVVLDHVSLAVDAGEHLELRGVNGSGKTTLARLLAGARPPSAGRREVHGAVAYVPAALEPPRLSVGAWLTGLRPHRTLDAVRDALGTLAFAGTIGNTFDQLSYGNTRKVLLADALTAGAALVVIDEAREGLDERGIDGLAALIERACSAGTAVVVADQAAHPVAPGATALAVRDGRLHAHDASDATTGVDAATTTYVGPRRRLDELDAAAEALGFRRLPETGTT